MTKENRDIDDIERKLRAYFQAEEQEMEPSPGMWERLSARLGEQEQPLEMLKWLPPWKKRWLLAVPATALIAAVIAVAVIYIGESEPISEPTVISELTATSQPVPTSEPPPTSEAGPPLVSLAPAVVLPGLNRTDSNTWVVDPGDDTITKLAPDGQELGTFSVTTGLDLVSVALAEESEAPLAGVYVHGKYAFVGGMSTGYRTDDNVGIRILDLSDPTNPELVGRIPLRSRQPFSDHSHGDAIATHMETEAFQGDVAIVTHGVPDTFTPDEYPEPHGIWDVNDPSNPQFLSVLNLGRAITKLSGGDLGDKPHDSKAVVGHYFFTLYANVETTMRCSRPIDGQRPADCPPLDDHLAVVDLSDPRNPVVVGDWHDDGLVGSLRGLSINKAGTRAYIVSIGPPPFGTAGKEVILYILDIQDRKQPVEIGRYVYPYPGPWVHSPYAVPNDDDSLVILADGRWADMRNGCSGHGRLHF
ncbi:MAG: LVIVD repeat-containing protein, partial [Dehalococcoidia bacterium]